MQFEIYDKETNETIDMEKDEYFKNFGVMIGLDGHMCLTQYGTIIAGVNEKYYGLRMAEE